MTSENNDTDMNGSDRFEIYVTDVKTLRVLVTNAITKLRQGKPVAAYDDLRELDNMVEQWCVDVHSVDAGTERDD